MAKSTKDTRKKEVEFDITPAPRVLPMLGEINIDQWRCIAELVDNSVDSFLNESRSGNDVSDAKVDVHLPQADSTAATLRVIDNGPGMTPSQLENAVRAGWSGNNPIDNLGLFGMGFNIATARLGSITEVWTTRRGENEWHGIEIDFDKLREQKHFRTTHKVRAKIDPEQHGTEITVRKIKPEQRKWLAKGSSQTIVRKRLSQAYSSMLRDNGKPIGFRLYVNQKRISPQNHCLWSETRTVPGPDGTSVSPIITISSLLPNRLYCTSCMSWLASAAESNTCPNCDAERSLVERDRKVFGWLGIQRYLHETDFGIDFVRNGRKIEIGNKDLFSWIDEEAEDREYPIDDPRGRGRIVGEIHIDHCRVSYAKDRFDRTDPSWKDMVRIVRGEGPIRPEKAKNIGYGPNTSPLGLLFSAFRRSSPKSKTAGAYARLLIVRDNAVASDMAKAFHKGDLEYQDDEKWWMLVEEADSVLLNPRGRGGEFSHSGAGQLPDGLLDKSSGDTENSSSKIEDNYENNGNNVVPERIEVSALSKTYNDNISGTRWDVRAFRVRADDPDLKDGAPWAFIMGDISTKTYHFLFDSEHPVFQSVTMGPRDALLTQLSFLIIDQLRDGGGIDFSRILSSFRKNYCSEDALDLKHLPSDASSVLSDVAHNLASSCPDDEKPSLFNDLSLEEQNRVMRSLASKGIRQPATATSDGSFLPFAPFEILQSILEKRPELCFDGKIWSDPYDSIDFKDPEITQEARESILSYYLSLISDAVWLSRQEFDSLSNTHRTKIIRAIKSIQLLRPDVEIST